MLVHHGRLFYGYGNIITCIFISQYVASEMLSIFSFISSIMS